MASPTPLPEFRVPFAGSPKSARPLSAPPPGAIHQFAEAQVFSPTTT